MRTRGILVSLLGITNIGKTTQRDLLLRAIVKRKCGDQGIGREMKAADKKYPVYDLEPTGRQINDYLRNKNPANLTPVGFQELNVKNKQQFEPELLKMLAENDAVIVEMYTGTSIAYGMGDGIDKDVLINMNTGLLEPDVSILLDGSRFKKSIEAGHVYENDDEKTEKIRLIHLDLAKQFGWQIVNANQTEDKVHDDIFNIVSKSLKEIMVPMVEEE
jgi:thymidylate kinase